ncbi:3-oxo-5-alpha-steroid 4-dehydrogenase 1 [Brachypodium distachyon]|uniref:3-oxo-5-alpha-steroid 4-dehydrogenase 1 n=1 Tax=Brachypodium distachyon TaxID=15368 RepID=UPI00052FE5AA|nr:3-oxo-5-alpha-steroid 4-dehydrogenase 1 [Brachypodium distachyon]|eukprot:XP_003557569.2 3-oxo-5-alpha-steroid 4-dehydrogenase 1 [Brachypodium distachyon]
MTPHVTRLCFPVPTPPTTIKPRLPAIQKQMRNARSTSASAPQPHDLFFFHTQTDGLDLEGDRRALVEMWQLLPSALLYPAPASAFVTAMSVLSSASLASAGLSELRGQHMAYSKFWHVVASGSTQKNPGGGGERLLSSRDGMLVAYAPALVAAAASFALPGALEEGLRAQLLAGALAVHFLKRVLEVLFVHRYSGSMPLNTALMISSSYLLSTITMIYSLHLAAGLPEPSINLLYPGVLVFTVGIAGNFYHHYLLSRLRKGSGTTSEGDKSYKIPTGGLFGLVACPHYLFEIAGFFGFAMISQTVYALAMASGTAAYLTGRSCATRRWYASKFEEYPARIKALVPYIL